MIMETDMPKLTGSKIKYSDGELKVFGLLRRSPQTSTNICERYYAPKKPAFYGRQIVTGLLSSLIRKMEENKEPITIRKTMRSGPIPIQFWIR